MGGLWSDSVHVWLRSMVYGCFDSTVNVAEPGFITWYWVALE